MLDRGDEDDRRVLEARMRVDHARGFVTVHDRHVEVEQEHGEIVRHQQLQRFGAGVGLDQVFLHVAENGAIREQA
jgi:hypothetical protein